MIIFPFAQPLKKEQIAMLRVPNSMASIMAYVWQHRFITSAGDPTPNGDQIQLEYQTKKGMFLTSYSHLILGCPFVMVLCLYLEIYGMYKKNRYHLREECLGRASFNRIWAACFSYAVFRYNKL